MLMVKDIFYGRNKMAHHEMPDELDIKINLKNGSKIKMIQTPTGENPFFKKFREHSKDHRDTGFNEMYSRFYGAPITQEPVFEKLYKHRGDTEPEEILVGFEPIDEEKDKDGDEEPKYIQQIKKIKEQLKSGRIVISCQARAMGRTAHKDLMEHIEKLQLKEMMANAGFPLVPPQDSIVIDSFSNLTHAEEAMLMLAKTGITTAQASKDLILAMRKLGEVDNIYEGFPKEEDNSVLYRKRQAAHWANKHSHKIRRKL